MTKREKHHAVSLCNHTLECINAKSAGDCKYYHNYTIAISGGTVRGNTY